MYRRLIYIQHLANSSRFIFALRTGYLRLMKMFECPTALSFEMWPVRWVWPNWPIWTIWWDRWSCCSTTCRTKRIAREFRYQAISDDRTIATFHMASIARDELICWLFKLFRLVLRNHSQNQTKSILKIKLKIILKSFKTVSNHFDRRERTISQWQPGERRIKEVID